MKYSVRHSAMRKIYSSYWVTFARLFGGSKKHKTSTGIIP
jgi:hypothetical protein